MLYLVTRESHVRRSLAIALHVTYHRTSYAARTQHGARVKPRDSHTLVVCVACAQSVAVLLFCPPPRFPGGGGRIRRTRRRDKEGSPRPTLDPRHPRSTSYRSPPHPPLPRALLGFSSLEILLYPPPFLPPSPPPAAPLSG